MPEHLKLSEQVLNLDVFEEAEARLAEGRIELSERFEFKHESNRNDSYTWKVCIKCSQALLGTWTRAVLGYRDFSSMPLFIHDGCSAPSF